MIVAHLLGWVCLAGTAAFVGVILFPWVVDRLTVRHLHAQLRKLQREEQRRQRRR